MTGKFTLHDSTSYETYRATQVRAVPYPGHFLTAAGLFDREEAARAVEQKVFAL